MSVGCLYLDYNFDYLYIESKKSMEELCQMLTHKLRLISNKIDYKNMSKIQKDELLDTLLIEKKKQSLRVLVESRLQQAMATRHINADDEIKYSIKAKSFDIMRIHLPQLPLTQEASPLATIVKLFITFFSMVSCSHRSQEIKTIYEKRLCPKSLIAATLFNWLVEWTRKQFQQYLKLHIHSLYVNNRHSVSVHEGQKQKQLQEGSRNNDSLDQIGLFLQHFPSKLLIHKREVKKRQAQQLPKSLQKLRIMSQNNLRPVNRENISEDQSLPINRQVFFFAFAEELQAFYKRIEDCVPDLESSWARRLKKGGRRQETLRRVNVVAESCIKQMPLIKQSVEAYRQLYLKHQSQRQFKRQERSRNKQIQHLKTTQEKKKKKKKKQLNQKQEQTKINVKNHKENESQIRQAEKLIFPIKDQTPQQLSNDKKRKRTQTIIKNYRYSVDFEGSSQSNLLKTSQKQKRNHKKQQLSLQVSHKTLDLSVNREKQQSTYLLINQRGFSHDLQIIQEKGKKMKARVLHGRSNKHFLSQHKEKTHQELFKSIETDKSVEKPFNSAQESPNKSPKMYIKLPKVRGLK